MLCLNIGKLLRMSTTIISREVVIKSQIKLTSTTAIVKKRKDESIVEIPIPISSRRKNKGKTVIDEENTDFVEPKAKKIKVPKSPKEKTKVKEATPENTDEDDDFLPEPKETKKTKEKVKGKAKKTKNKSLVADIENSPYQQQYRAMTKNTRSDMKIGAHLSIAEGIEKVPSYAVSIGATAFAIFTGSQRQWSRKLPSEEACTAFKEECTKRKFAPKHILPHGSYLINLGSPEEDKLEKSRELFLLEMKSCQMLGLSLYNFHPGSHREMITEDECLARIAESINIAHTKTQGVTAVLEVTAGAGAQVGQRFEHIKKIIDGVTDKSRVGVCLDTCHMFAAGYDISTEKGYMSVMSKFDEIVGLKYLRGMHINDSKSTLGSKADRHENIGKGELGKACFERIVNDPHLKDIPMILETSGPFDQEIKLLYSMLK
eukprot:Phypoly_transcript_09018.p1 GENE.Phypoly_transcript_09018~~Phypoly_transcript_09018.p1  ORF type:complete len:431 (+),score=72.39 Phypoly_transcript_09018:105-1397(+)